MIRTNGSEFILRNQQEYKDSYTSMKWLTTEQADGASHLRDELMRNIFNAHPQGPGLLFSDTKIFTHDISPGCRLCGEGGWSCLFINGICNARCFYCPSAQNDPGPPMTSTIEFSNPHDYADYVNTFRIRGVSFSGGEPFLTFDRVLLFLKTLRAKVSSPLYIWMYTNGILATDDKLKSLRDNGLDEIRFDLSANRYHLDALKKAVNVIPRVTVEIPAIPEDIDNTRQLLKVLHDTGVHHLNLHQLRCTPFNKTAFIHKGYTFVHGPGVTILETELTALRLIQYALDHHIDLPINYCSFTYRNQFQKAGGMRRNALLMKTSHEDITPTGHIRTMSLNGEKEQIGSIHQSLVAQGTDRTLWQISKTCDQLFFNEGLWAMLILMDLTHVRLKISYSSTSLKSAVSFHHAYREVPLNRKKKVVIERRPRQNGIWLEGEQIHEFYHIFIKEQQGLPAKDLPEHLSPDLLKDIRAFESFIPGLAPYY